MEERRNRQVAWKQAFTVVCLNNPSLPLVLSTQTQGWRKEDSDQAGDIVSIWGQSGSAERKVSTSELQGRAEMQRALSFPPH